MPNNKSSTLPAVLKEYLPEYEPRKIPPKDVPSEKTRQAKPDGENTTPSQDVKAVSSSPSARTQKKARSSGQATEGPRNGRSRERTFVLQKKQEVVRYHRNYDDWQNIKQEFRDEKREKFQRKIALQKEIIRKRDELRQIRVDSDSEIAAKKRQEERDARRAQSEALLEVCRQSLDDERKLSSERAARRQARQKAKNNTSPESKPSLKPLGDRQLTNISERSAHSSLASVPLNGAPPTPPLLTDFQRQDHDEFTISEEEDEPEDVTQPADEDATLPWHHDQLYRLYGKEADYFLHPKIEQEKKSFDKPMNPKLRKQGGRAGAGVLWSTLRNDSRMKLLEEDANIPNELKFAYSAFVRQLLTRRRRPVKRNFYSEEDVPEMERLLDQTRLHAAQSFKHKVELMYRSSVTNEDRTGVLVFNAPLPNLNNKDGEESVARYLPSWLDDQADKESLASYLKWLPPQLTTDQLAKVEHASTPEDWSFLEPPKPKPSAHKQNSFDKIHFLTEKESTVPGEFSKRRKELLDAKNIPVSYTGGRGPGQLKSQSAMGRSMSEAPPISEGRRGQSVSPSSGLGWQPLSLHALAEYKKEKVIQGQGHFQQGAATVWPIKA